MGIPASSSRGGGVSVTPNGVVMDARVEAAAGGCKEGYVGKQDGALARGPEATVHGVILTGSIYTVGEDFAAALAAVAGKGSGVEVLRALEQDGHQHATIEKVACGVRVHQARIPMKLALATMQALEAASRSRDTAALLAALAQLDVPISDLRGLGVSVSMQHLTAAQRDAVVAALGAASGVEALQALERAHIPRVSVDKAACGVHVCQQRIPMKLALAIMQALEAASRSRDTAALLAALAQLDVPISDLRGLGVSVSMQHLSAAQRDAVVAALEAATGVEALQALVVVKEHLPVRLCKQSGGLAVKFSGTAAEALGILSVLGDSTLTKEEKEAQLLDLGCGVDDKQQVCGLLETVNAATGAYTAVTVAAAAELMGSHVTGAGKTEADAVWSLTVGEVRARPWAPTL